MTAAGLGFFLYSFCPENSEKWDFFRGLRGWGEGKKRTAAYSPHPPFPSNPTIPYFSVLCKEKKIRRKGEEEEDRTTENAFLYPLPFCFFSLLFSNEKAQKASVYKGLREGGGRWLEGSSCQGQQDGERGERRGP